tara:strand:+ start:2318 stop:2692 length:375 start_codon:yes stop_codon:yes gene_type:complete
MSMTNKSVLQKLYEKRRMIEMDPGSIKVMYAVRAAGAGRGPEPGLYLCIGNAPIAKLLPAKEIDETVPDFDKSEAVELSMGKMKELDPRTSIEDLDEVVGTEFEETFYKMAGVIFGESGEGDLK